MNLEPASYEISEARPIESQHTSRVSATIAGFLSAILPGLGQIYLHRAKVGAAYLFLVVLLRDVIGRFASRGFIMVAFY